MKTAATILECDLCGAKSTVSGHPSGWLELAALWQVLPSGGSAGTRLDYCPDCAPKVVEAMGWKP